MEKNKIVIKNAFIDSIPVLLEYLFLGAGFGVLLSAKGYNIIWSLFMSVTMFTGSLQYIAVDMMAQNLVLYSVVITTILVNIRYMFYSFSMINKYSKSPFSMRFFLIFGLTDETYSLVCIDNDKNTNYNYCLLLSLFNYAYWLIGTSAGNLAGELIPSRFTEGIEFILVAMFVTVMTSQIISSKKYFPSFLGVASGLLFLFFVPTSYLLIPSMVVIIIALLIYKRYLEKKVVNNG